MRVLALLGALSLGAAFGPPARAATRPLVRHFAPIEFSATETRLSAETENKRKMREAVYDGTGKRPDGTEYDLPDDTALRVLAPPFAFAIIIAIASQVLHFK